MAIPVRFAPVLVGDEAVEFYERWHETMNKPDSRRPSEKEIKEIRMFFRKHKLEELNNLVDEAR